MVAVGTSCRVLNGSWKEEFQAAIMSGRHIADGNFEGPITPHWVIQAAIVHELKQHYKPQRHMPHELFILLMRMNDRASAVKPARRSRPTSRRTQPPAEQQLG
jgi:hypothetical protein